MGAQSYSGTLVNGPFYVGLWQGLNIRFIAVANDQELIIAWWLDEALTIPLGSRRLSVETGDIATISFPNQGPWVTTSTQEVGAGNGSRTLRVVPTNRVMSGPMLETSGRLVDERAVVLAAGAQSISDLLQWYAGPAHFWAIALTAPGTFSLLSGPAPLATDYFFQVDAAANQRINGPLLIPPEICEAEITNQGAVNGTFWFVIIPDHFRT